MAKQKQTSDLWSFARGLTTLASAEGFFNRLLQESKPYDSPATRSLIHTGIHSLMESSTTDSARGGEIIKKYILPSCLEKDAPLPSELLSAREAREILSNWLGQYPDETRILIRAGILERIGDVLKAAPSVASIVTLGTVGLRARWIERILARFIDEPGPLGVAAVEALCSLSPTKRLRSLLITVVLRRDPHGHTTDYDYAIQELASTRFIPMLRERGLRKDDDVWRTPFLLGRISEYAPGDQRLQARVWHVFEAMLDTRADAGLRVIPTGNTIANCNNARLVPKLLENIGNPNFGLHSIANHLKECFRPEQLSGWQFANKLALKAELAKYATLPGSQTRSMTVEDGARISAWEIAFCAGILDVSDWLLAVDVNSPLAVAETLRYSSYASLRTWPSLVTQLVTERIDIGEGADPWLSARLAAAEMLASTETMDALDVLVDCGATGAGAPLRSTTELIGDMSERLSFQCLDELVERLFHICEDRTRGSNRVSAIVGLQRLAAVNQVSSEYVDRVLSLAYDDSLPHYATAAVIWVAACFEATKTRAPFVERLVQQLQASVESEEIRFQSLQALIHLDLWAEHKEAILRALWLSSDNGRIDASYVRSYKGWESYALGLLVKRAPDLFSGAAKQILEDGNGQAVHLLLRALDRGATADEGKIIELGRSALERARRLLGGSFGETDNFQMIARLVPKEFVRVEWQDLWSDWMPQVRSALADAFQQVSDSGENDKRRMTELLEGLLSDSAFSVRRSAARTYSRLSPEGLSRLCEVWMRSGQTELRVRCAENAAWLPVDDPKSMDNSIIRALLKDPEPSVRNVAKRSLSELRRSAWRAVALARIRSGADDPRQWISNSYCYGRALVALGDDETVAALHEMRKDRSIAINVRNWLKHLAKDVESHWREVTQKWPEQLPAWSGQIEEIDCEFSVDDYQLKSRVSLWLRRQEDPTDTNSWGGGFSMPSLGDRMRLLLQPKPEPALLTIRGRQSARIWFSGSSDERIFFLGTGSYPNIGPSN